MKNIKNNIFVELFDIFPDFRKSPKFICVSWLFFSLIVEVVDEVDDWVEDKDIDKLVEELGSSVGFAWSSLAAKPTPNPTPSPMTANPAITVIMTAFFVWQKENPIMPCQWKYNTGVLGKPGRWK